MSKREDDLRLERELRELLRERDPGPAPYGLRGRVEGVPDADPAPHQARRLARVLIPVLGLAAGIALLLLAAPFLAPLGGGPGAGAPTTPAQGFDPTIAGPGLVPPPGLEAEAPIVLGLLLAGGLALVVAPSGPRRGVAAVGIVLVLAVGGFQVLRTHAAPGPVASSGGIGVLNVDPALGVDPYPVYVTAGPGEPFSLGFSVKNLGPLPIRLAGVVNDPAITEGQVGYPTLQAVWRGDEQNDGVGGPVEPFTGSDLAPGDHVLLWLVAAAPSCAAGPSYDPATDQLALVGMPAPRVAYSVLGFPRTAAIDLPYELLQPLRAGCPPQP